MAWWWFHPILYDRCNYLSLLQLKLIHISIKAPQKYQMISNNNWLLELIVSTKIYVTNISSLSCDELIPQHNFPFHSNNATQTTFTPVLLCTWPAAGIQFNLPYLVNKKFIGIPLDIFNLNQDLGPISLTFFSIAIQIQWKFRFTLTSILIQWSLQNSVHAVVACAKICCDLMASNRVTARQSFHRIWIAGKNLLVKQTPETHCTNDFPWLFLNRTEIMFYCNSFPGCHKHFRHAIAAQMM